MKGLNFCIIVLLFYLENCQGLPVNFYSGNLTPKIVGGAAVDIKEVPYQLSLLKNGKLNCGAVIISSNWAVTTAHCVQGEKLSGLTLRSGSSEYKSGGKVHSIEKSILHENYNNKTSDYDIALLKTTDNLILDNNSQKVVLPSQGWIVSPGTNAIVTGWGSVKEGGAISSKLLRAAIPIASTTECSSAYGKGKITERMICAGLTTGGRGFCQGDSGGPLIADGKLVGLVSWSSGCAKPGLPGVYTNIGSFRNWIISVSGQ